MATILEGEIELGQEAGSMKDDQEMKERSNVVVEPAARKAKTDKIVGVQITWIAPKIQLSLICDYRSPFDIPAQYDRIFSIFGHKSKNRFGYSFIESTMDEVKVEFEKKVQTKKIN